MYDTRILYSEKKSIWQVLYHLGKEKSWDYAYATLISEHVAFHKQLLSLRESQL